MATHRFSTPEGIEVTVEIQGTEIIDDCQCLDFTVKVEVPGYKTLCHNLPPWKQTLDISACRAGTATGEGEV